MLNSEPTATWFRHMCSVKLSSEGLEFLLESSKLLDPDMSEAEAASIWTKVCRKYVAQGSEAEINIAGATRDRLLSSQDHSQPRMYLLEDGALEEARNEVLHMLDRQYYVVFKQMIRKAKENPMTSPNSSPRRMGMKHHRRRRSLPRLPASPASPRPGLLRRKSAVSVDDDALEVEKSTRPNRPVRNLLKSLTDGSTCQCCMKNSLGPSVAFECIECGKSSCSDCIDEEQCHVCAGGFAVCPIKPSKRDSFWGTGEIFL